MYSVHEKMNFLKGSEVHYHWGWNINCLLNIFFMRKTTKIIFSFKKCFHKKFIASSCFVFYLFLWSSCDVKDSTSQLKEAEEMDYENGENIFTIRIFRVLSVKESGREKRQDFPSHLFFRFLDLFFVHFHSLLFKEWNVRTISFLSKVLLL